MFKLLRRADSWEVHVLVRDVVLKTAVLVAAVLFVLVVSREAASSPSQDVVVAAPDTASLIVTSPAGGLAGPGLLIDRAVLDAEQCLTVEAGSSVLAAAGTDTSSVWVFADPGDLVRIDYESPSRSESSLIPQSDLEHEFAPGRITVTVMAGDADATVRFAALSSSTRLCGLTAE